MYDLCEFLLRLHERGELRTDFVSLPLTVPYHAPCQQRGHGIGKPALDLLALVPDLHMIELDVECCGIAGTYGIKKEKYEISMAVGERLFSDITATGSDLAACDSETCRWQIAHGAGVTAVHPIELLYRAYGLDRAGRRSAGDRRHIVDAGARVIMAKRRTHAVLEASPTGQAVMRVDDVLLSRGERGTWRIDLRGSIRRTATGRCRSRSASIAPSTASPGSSGGVTDPS